MVIPILVDISFQRLADQQTRVI